MYNSLPGFYNWYSDAAKLIALGSLRFNLIDINWRPEKVFVLPESQPEHFRMLKQHIWDLFWLTSSHKPGPPLFRIAIYPLPATSDYANKESSKLQRGMLSIRNPLIQRSQTIISHTPIPFLLVLQQALKTTRLNSALMHGSLRQRS
jgi:hypothetical protein